MNTPLPPSPFVVALPARRNYLRALVRILIIVLVVSIPGLLIIEKLYPDVYTETITNKLRIPPLYKTVQNVWYVYGPKTAEQKALDALYATYCAPENTPMSQVKIPLNITTSSFGEIDAAIRGSLAAQTPEPISLLRTALVKMAQDEDPANTRLGKDAITATREQSAQRTSPEGAAFTKRFSASAAKLGALFHAFQKAGFTQSQSQNPITIGGVEHQVTNQELLLYSYWYGSINDVSYQKISAAKQREVDAVLFAYLEEINELLTFTLTSLTTLSQSAEIDIQKEVALSFDDELQLLQAGTPNDPKTGLHLSGFGSIILHEKKDFDESFRWQLCAAQNYYDPLSMYNLGGYYSNGVGANSAQGEVAVRIPLTRDIRTSYFWHMTLVLVDNLQYGFFTDAGRQTGWNTIAGIDAIQNGGELSIDELSSIEQEAHAFVAQKYPDVGTSGLEAEVHSMGSMIDALQQATGLPKEELNTQATPTRQ